MGIQGINSVYSHWFWYLTSHNSSFNSIPGLVSSRLVSSRLVSSLWTYWTCYLLPSCILFISISLFHSIIYSSIYSCIKPSISIIFNYWSIKPSISTDGYIHASNPQYILWIMIYSCIKPSISTYGYIHASNHQYLSMDIFMHQTMSIYLRIYACIKPSFYIWEYINASNHV